MSFTVGKHDNVIHVRAVITVTNRSELVDLIALLQKHQQENPNERDLPAVSTESTESADVGADKPRRW